MNGADKDHASEKSNKISAPALDYRALFEAVPDPCLVLDRSLQIVAVNEAYLSATMTKREEILNHGMFEVFPDNPDEPNATGVRNLKGSLNRVLRNQVVDVMAVQKYDVRKPVAEGGGFEERYWSPINIPVLGPDNRLSHIIHRVQDVTEFVHLKQKEEEICAQEKREQAVKMEAEIYAKAQQVAAVNLKLKQANEVLDEFNQELKTFNYMVSHDLRQPLNTIGTSCQAFEMLCSDKIDVNCNNFIQIVHKTMLGMNKLIEALLKFSSSAHSDLQREDINLSEVAKSVVAELRSTEPDRQATFKITEGLMANGDHDLLISVLQNLIGNAWKYSATRKHAVIDFGAAEVNGHHTFFVRDNGTGFDMADADKLFMPFKRLPGAEDYKGSGIGLAIAERIIRRHGGRIWADGKPGKGATFFFTLPEKNV